eukprot:scaffold667_cov103-Skeletonema_dohrnii-CCMP3373.AAC.5
MDKAAADTAANGTDTEDDMEDYVNNTVAALIVDSRFDVTYLSNRHVLWSHDQNPRRFRLCYLWVSTQWLEFSLIMPRKCDVMYGSIDHVGGYGRRLWREAGNSNVKSEHGH